MKAATKRSTGSVKQRLLALAGLGAAALLALSACSASSGGQSGASSGPAAKNPPKITKGEPFVHPTDVEVPGLSGQLSLSSTGSEARWAYLPGEQPFNRTLAGIVGGYLDAQAESRGVAYTPEAHPVSANLVNRGCVSGSTALSAREILDNPELYRPTGGETQLVIACEPVLAAGTTFAERLRFVRGNASEVASDAVEVLYTDTASGEVARGRELFTEAAMPVLYEALFDVLNLEQPMSGNEVIPPSPETLSDLHKSLSNVGFKDNGDAVVTVDRAFISVIASGDPDFTPEATTLVVPADRSAELLSELGQAISSSKREGEGWAGPAPVPAGNQFVDCGLVPCVAVTYDDGPSYLTPTVLDAYAGREHAAATFFLLGQNIPGNEEILTRTVAEGHELANHSWDHPAFTTVSDEGIRQQLDSTTQLITEATGQEVKVFRPPYGDLNERTLAATGMPSILWSVDTNDWQQPGGEAIISQAVNDARPDGIVLMHDIHETTVSVAGDIVDGLLARGFTLVTVSQLFDGIEMGSTMYWSAEDYR